MYSFPRFAALSAFAILGLACGLITSPLTGAQNLASTAEALATTLPSSLTAMPGVPDVTGYLNPTGAPVSEWNGIPIMPQATAGQEFNANTYSYKAGALAQTDVQAFYDEKLKALGWSSVFNAGGGTEGGFMLFSKESKVLTITLAKADSETVVLLIME